MPKISVEQAAKMLGVSKQTVRIGLREGTLPIGSAVKTSSVWTYIVSEHLLEQYIGQEKCAALRQQSDTDEDNCRNFGRKVTLKCTTNDFKNQGEIHGLN